MENINEILKEEYKLEELREKDINPLYRNKNKARPNKIYIGVDGLVRSDGIPEDYNGKNARIKEIKEVNKIIS